MIKHVIVFCSLYTDHLSNWYKLFIKTGGIDCYAIIKLQFFIDLCLLVSTQYLNNCFLHTHGGICSKSTCLWYFYLINRCQFIMINGLDWLAGKNPLYFIILLVFGSLHTEQLKDNDVNCVSVSCIVNNDLAWVWTTAMLWLLIVFILKSMFWYG